MTGRQPYRWAPETTARLPQSLPFISCHQSYTAVHPGIVHLYTMTGNRDESPFFNKYARDVTALQFKERFKENLAFD